MRGVVGDPPVRPVRAGALAPVLYGLLEKDPVKRWDVIAARQVLRELLAGPLANSATHHVTDPYAVVPPTPVPAPRPAEAPSGQIGGRAMLAPGELPTDRRPGPAPAFPGAPVAPPRPNPAHGLGDRLRRLPMGAKLGIAAGIAAAMLVAVVAVARMSRNNPKPVAVPTVAPSPTGPPFPVKSFADDRGFVLDVPAAWTQSGKPTSYYDFVDPQDGARRLRVNVETPSGTPTPFLQPADR